MAIWTRPALVVMGKLRYPAKFSLVSTLFLIPMVLVLVLYLQQSHDNISMTETELQGVDRLAVSTPLLLAVGDSRVQASRWLNGNAGAESRFASQRREVSKLLAEFGDNKQGESQSVLEQVNALQKRWQTLNQAVGSAGTSAMTEHHNDVSESVRSANVALIRTYQLELDGELFSSFLIEMVARDLPLLIDEVDQLRAQAIGISTAGRFSPDRFIAISNLLARVSKDLHILKPRSDIDYLTEEADAIRQRMLAAGKLLNAYLATLKNRMVDPDQIEITLSEVQSESDRVMASLKVLHETIYPELKRQKELYLADKQLDRALVLSVLAVTLLLAIYLFIGFYRSTMEVVDKFRAAADQLASGDLSVRLELCTRDEMSEVSKGLNQVAEGFETVVGNVLRSTSGVTDTAAALSRESATTLQGVELQQQETGNIVSAIQQLSENTASITHNTSSALEQAQSVDEMATSGREVVQGTVTAFSGMSSEIARTSTVIGQLGEDVSAISEMSGSIKSIAEQTNLLALNAAIEAARAGDQGRGFAVVADEVRQLAIRTQQATEEIQRTIEQLQQRTDDAVSLMQENQRTMDVHTGEITRAGELIGTIDDSVADMYRMNSDIAQASTVLSDLVADLEQNVATISSVANDAGQAAQHSADLAVSLTEDSRQLKDSLSTFRLS